MSDIDGRTQSAYDVIETFEPVGYSRASDTFIGLEAHKDDQIVHDSNAFESGRLVPLSGKFPRLK